MYEILYFRGGAYKFNELVEYTEDIGGMVLNKDCFEIYDSLNRIEVWTEKERLKGFIRCPCYALLCNQIGDEYTS